MSCGLNFECINEGIANKLRFASTISGTLISILGTRTCTGIQHTCLGVNRGDGYFPPFDKGSGEMKTKQAGAAQAT